MNKISTALLFAWMVIGCNGFVGEVSFDEAEGEGATIEIADPDYLILRPVWPTQARGTVSATADGQTVYYVPTQRIMDLRHFDPRTARLEESGPGTYAVSLSTTADGNRLLGDWTAANLGRQLGVFVGGDLVAAPHIHSRITEMIVVGGEMTRVEAEAVVARMRRGGATE